MKDVLCAGCNYPLLRVRNEGGFYLTDRHRVAIFHTDGRVESKCKCGERVESLAIRNALRAFFNVLDRKTVDADTCSLVE